jgi:hypothetical protein
VSGTGRRIVCTNVGHPPKMLAAGQMVILLGKKKINLQNGVVI